MKLLIYSDMSSDAWGGSEILWTKLIPVLQDRGVQVAATTFASRQARQVCQRHGLSETMLLPRSAVRPSRRVLPKVLNKLSGRAMQRARQRVWLDRQRRFCDHVCPDVVFVSMAWPESGISLHPFLKHTGTPYVCFLHGVGEAFAKHQASAERRSFLEGAAKVLLTGQRSERLLEQWLGHPLTNAVPTLNFVDCDYFAPRAGASARDASESTKLLCVARLSVRDKGQDVLLEALADLRDLNWRLTLAGDGPDRELLEQQAAQLALEERVAFLGDTPNAEVRELLSTHDVFALSSRNEGLPLSLLEAMACALPCVATDVGSVREILEDEKGGLLVKPEDAASLGRALRRMIEDEALRRRCATHAMALVREKCEESAFLARVADVIDQAVASRPSRESESAHAASH
jgi:glycosyltransferase involved in cell wall biosynthesis